MRKKRIGTLHAVGRSAKNARNASLVSVCVHAFANGRRTIVHWLVIAQSMSKSQPPNDAHGVGSGVMNTSTPILWAGIDIHTCACVYACYPHK